MPRGPDQDRTGDILKDAADDIEDDWPFHAKALRVMHGALKGLSQSSDEETRAVASLALQTAEQAANGE